MGSRSASGPDYLAKTSHYNLDRKRIPICQSQFGESIGFFVYKMGKLLGLVWRFQ